MRLTYAQYVASLEGEVTTWRNGDKAQNGQLHVPSQ